MFKFIPFPRKFFSVIPPPIVDPPVPTPAPKEISPVGFSSTETLTIFKFASDPSIISDFTFLKIPNDFMLSIDLLNKSSFNGSPSSTISLFLITSSIVLKFPNMFTLST